MIKTPASTKKGVIKDAHGSLSIMMACSKKASTADWTMTHKPLAIPTLAASVMGLRTALLCSFSQRAQTFSLALFLSK